MSESRLSALAKHAEDAHAEYAQAVDAHSEAYAAHQRAWHTAYLKALPDCKSVAAAERTADAASYETEIAMKVAANGVERAKSLVRTRLAVLSAAQTHYRAERDLAG